MNKLFLFVLLFLFGCEPISSKEKSREDRKEELQQKIKQLKEQIRSFEIQAINDEIEGQAAMRSNYQRFAEELQSSEKHEQHAEFLEQQLKLLLKEQEQLEKSS